MPEDRSIHAAGKHAAMQTRQEAPFNGGPPLYALADEFVTSAELFFVRSHGSPPPIDPASYQLTISGLVARPLRFGLAELRERFPRVTVTATLQCAGNRRDELLELGPIPDELVWGAEALSTAVWSGVSLRAVLELAQPLADVRHIAFGSCDQVTKAGTTFSFGGSIPLEKAMSDEVLIADTLNGEPLPPLHGFPLRVLVPGYIGARSVKWLTSIVAQPEPSENYFQAHAYRLFASDVTPATVDWSAGMMLGELSLTSAICQPAHGAQLSAGPLRIAGYAMAGGGRTIERVDVSSDGGATWRQAELGTSLPWAWRLWSCQLDLAPGAHQLVVRAWDSAANTQPEQLETVWNFKGYMNNAWHRIDVFVS